MKKCDIIIPVWNEKEATAKCVGLIEKHTRFPYRLIIIDNGGEEGIKEYLASLEKKMPETLMIKNSRNLGFVKAVNQGIVASSSAVVCVLNNDAYVTEGWLTSLMATLEKGPDNIGMINPSSNMLGQESKDGKPFEWQELDTCRGFCMLIKREVIDKIGLFDEVYGMGYFEERDYCMRAREEGFICARAKSSYVFHEDMRSFNKLGNRDTIFRENEKIFNKRWGRSINAAFIIRETCSLPKATGILYELLRNGHKVFFFSQVSEKKAGLKDHINIRFKEVFAFFLPYSAFFNIMKKKSKKKIELIVADNMRDLKIMNRLKPFLGAVAAHIDDDIRNICRNISMGE